MDDEHVLLMMDRCFVPHKLQASHKDGKNNEICNGDDPSTGDITSETTTQSPAHCHDRTENQAAAASLLQRSKRKLIVALVLVFVFTIVEFVGGVLSNSLAIGTDALHLLTDFMGFAINLFSLQISTRKPSRVLNFGWQRIEILGAMLSIFLLWVVTGCLVYMAVLRCMDQSFVIEPVLMIIMAAIGVLFNIIQSLNLVGVHGHGHSHGSSSIQEEQAVSKAPESTHKPASGLLSDKDSSASYGALSTGPTDDVNDTEMEIFHEQRTDSKSAESNAPQGPAESINVRAALIHVLGDFAQSIGVLIAATVLYFKPEWKLIDPLCTFTFSFVVLMTTCSLLKEITLTLTEAVPSSLSHEGIQRHLASVSGVLQVHDLRLWAMTSHRTCASVHLAIGKSADPHPFEVVQEAEFILKNVYKIHFVTVQTEEYNDVIESCAQCKMGY